MLNLSIQKTNKYMYELVKEIIEYNKKSSLDKSRATLAGKMNMSFVESEINFEDRPNEYTGKFKVYKPDPKILQGPFNRNNSFHSSKVPNPNIGGSELKRQSSKFNMTIVEEDNVSVNSDRSKISNISSSGIKKIKYTKLLSVYQNHDSQLEDFLDFILRNDESYNNTIIHRRIELYLEKLRDSNEESKPIVAEQIMSLIKNKVVNEKVDKNYLLLLFKFNNFKEGVIELAKCLDSEQEILSIYMQDCEFEKIKDMCDNYSVKDKNIWVQAFFYFVQFNPIETVFAHIKYSLNKIVKDNLISPLIVIDTLRKRKNIPVDVYREYMIQSLKERHSEMKSDKEAFDKTYSNVRTITKELQSLKTKPSTFNCQQCAICKEGFSQALNGSTPVSKIVIYLCKHTFHPLCLNNQGRFEVMDHTNEEKKCPICNYKLDQIKQRIAMTNENSVDHNSFFRQLQSKTNKFDFIAKNIGKVMIRTDL